MVRASVRKVEIFHLRPDAPWRDGVVPRASLCQPAAGAELKDI